MLAVCDVWQDRRENATNRVNAKYAQVYGQGQYKACQAYTDFRHVLDRPDIDAVLIASGDVDGADVHALCPRGHRTHGLSGR